MTDNKWKMEVKRKGSVHESRTRDTVFKDDD